MRWEASANVLRPQTNAGAAISVTKKLAGDVTGVLVPNFRGMKKTIKCRDKYGRESGADLLPLAVMGVYGRCYVIDRTA